MSLESIRRELWMGEIPVCFALCSDDVETIVDQPEPCCVMLPRCSYLPLHIKEMESYFSKYVKTSLQGNQIWFECDGQKLKWHLPIGVTYDILYGVRTQGALWDITVHFGDYPEQELLRCPNVDCVKANFMSAVKEADSLKHGSRIMNEMRQPEHAMLWNGLLNRNFDEFWTINRRLMDVTPSETFRHLPVRVYTDYQHYNQPYLPGAREEDDSNPLLTLTDLLKYLEIDLSQSDTTILSQGIELDLASDVYKLSRMLSYPDNFLYICVHKHCSESEYSGSR